MRGKHNYRKPTRDDISKGRAYYEGRVNRADVKRKKYPMLKDGGMAEEVYYVNDFYPNYDEDKIAKVLKDNGFKKVRKAKKYGWSNQPDVVVFDGSKNKAQEILEKEFDNYISIYEKDWGRKYEEGGTLQEKLFSVYPHSIGKAKYVVDVYDGKSTHKDGSPFIGISTAKSKIQLNSIINSLKEDGFKEVYNVSNYLEKYEDGGYMAEGGKLNTEVILTENRSNGAKWRGVVKPFMMKSIERNQYAGGFKRYEIDIYDDVEREPSKEELKQANEFFDKVGGRFAKGGMMAEGGYVNVVLNEGNGKIINKLYNDWNNVKTEKEYKKWVEEVRSTKFGTYGTITYDEVMKNFDFDNAPINSFHLKTFKAELKNALNKDYKYEDGGYMAKGGEMGEELLGGQSNGQLKPSGYKLISQKGREIIVSDDGGETKERYVKNNGFSGYRLVYKGNDYEFTDSFEDGGYMEKGGRIYKDWNGRNTKEMWGKEDLYLKYDNTLDLIADVSDYYKKMGEDINENYAQEQKDDLIKVLQSGKINFNDGATLKFAKGGKVFYTEKHKND